MGQSKLELAVGTGQWDAGLKKAQQSLNAFVQSQGGLQQALDKDNGDMQKFVQMMANMTSTANTAKGQMNDYKNTIAQLSKSYSEMSAAQKASIGQDYLNTIDTLKQKFQDAKTQVDDLNRSLNDMGNIKGPEIGGGGGLFGGKGLTDMLSVAGGNLLASGLTKLGSELADTIQQSIELARQGEGVRLAFDRLNQPNLLENLKEATHGTVSELELMKAAIKFENFKLPLEDLGTYLAFAQQKAQDTGESVDFLVTSIVNGLGRQSVQILDNLGISAAEIKKRMKEGGDMTQVVAQIIRDEMTKAGEYVETSATRAARAAADAANEMEDLGRKAMPVAEEWSKTWNSIKMGCIEVLNWGLTPIVDSIKDIRELLSGEYTLKIRADIPNLADGPINPFNDKPGTDHKVQAPGGYVVVTDKNGNQIGAKHFDDFSGNAVDAWKKTLSTKKGGRGTKIDPAVNVQNSWDKAFANAVNGSEKLKASDSKDFLSPYQMMLPEIKKNILDIKDADLGGALAKIGEDKVVQQIKDIKTALEQEKMAFNTACQAAQNFGAALAGLEDPAAQAAGTVIQAIANIVLGFSSAAAQASSMGPYGWIAYLAAGLAATATTISTIHSLTGYAEGGMIKGNSYSGDNVGGLVDGSQFVGLNAGELVLNASQQNTLAQNLKGNGLEHMKVVGKLQGTDIVLMVDRTLKKNGKELAVWG